MSVILALSLTSCGEGGGSPAGDAAPDVSIDNPIPAGPLKDQIDSLLTGMLPDVDLEALPRGELPVGEPLRVAATGDRSLSLINIPVCPGSGVPTTPCLLQSVGTTSSTAPVSYSVDVTVDGTPIVSTSRVMQPDGGGPLAILDRSDPTHLSLTFQPPLVESLSVTPTEVLPASMTTRQVRLTVRATVDLAHARPPLTLPTGMGPVRAELAAPPISVPLAPLPLPHLVALFTEKEFRNQPETGFFVNVKPPVSGTAIQGDDICRQLAETLKPIGALHSKLAAFAWLASALLEIDDVAGKLGSPAMTAERSKCAVADEHSSTWGDRYKLNPGGWFSAGQVMVENEIDSLIMIAPPGSHGWFYIDNNFATGEGWFTLTSPATLVTKVPNMSSGTPPVSPSGALEVGAPAKSHYVLTRSDWFEDNLSSFALGRGSDQPPHAR